MGEIEDLIARLEKATAPDRGLDREIKLAHAAFLISGGAKAAEVQRRVGGDLYADPPPYTGSIDAALTLVPEGMYWHAGHGRTRADEPLGGASIIEPVRLGTVSEAEATTPAIALCIASLRALKPRATTGEE